MSRHEGVSRRSVLRSGAVAAGAVLASGTAIAGNSTAQEEQAGLASKIESHGHYAWFPFGPDSWGRSSSPYDLQNGDARWMAEPESDGAVRCLVRNLGTEPPNRNAGFDVHLGRLDNIETVTFRSKTVQTRRTTGPAQLFVGLYLDKNGNGEFFEWESGDGADSWVGFGGDDEGLASYAASGEVTIDGDTTFAIADAGTAATVDELTDGAVEGIDADTATAIYVGVVDSGEGTEEVVVEDVSVQQS
jgi:hypothetical protein